MPWVWVQITHIVCLCFQSAIPKGGTEALKAVPKGRKPPVSAAAVNQRRTAHGLDLHLKRQAEVCHACMYRAIFSFVLRLAAVAWRVYNRRTQLDPIGKTK